MIDVNGAVIIPKKVTGNCLQLTNPKSKSKVQVQVWADDWVFIKIRFSNQPATHPPSRPATRESFKEARYSNISKTKVVGIY